MADALHSDKHGQNDFSQDLAKQTDLIDKLVSIDTQMAELEQKNLEKTLEITTNYAKE